MGSSPKSLKGQLLLAVALALLLAQGISAALVYGAQNERRDAAIIHTAAMRLLPVVRGDIALVDEVAQIERGRPRGIRLEVSPQFAPLPNDWNDAVGEAELRRVLSEQGIEVAEVRVLQRRIGDDGAALRRFEQRERLRPDHQLARPRTVVLAAVRLGGQSQWLIARVMVPPTGLRPLSSLIGQTLLIFALVFGAIALIVGRITRPLKALTLRLERFGQTRDAEDQLEPEGPDDVRRLIEAHNTMEARVASLLDEKDVMLGAIGHDLKTPLAALRVRIESVEDDTERAKMAATIEDITRSLDDILSLARVGRPSDPLEPTDLSALIAQVAEEFEDMGEPVVFAGAERVVLSLRATWLRRAVRNLVVNALRYGKVARISLAREGARAVIRIEDDGPGIAEGQMGRMLEPFTRGEPSRSSTTGGAGLGLTLARAIAEQHGGALRLENRRDAAGTIAGLTATITIPI
ncbi:ATP-binding protein [Novosphingobium sp.]|uniref:sensor histidine kinase n=1 Tax=Novosphingobium sp. TaxID=1874826 RepID=UPI002869F1DE|nr:ATP-binding protein [Novosphingobium sp.]